MVVRITVVIVVNRFGTGSFGTALGWLLLSTFLSTILEVTQFGWYQQTIFHIWSAVAGYEEFTAVFQPIRKGQIFWMNTNTGYISRDRVANQSTRKTLSTVLEYTKRVYKGLNSFIGLVPRCVSLNATLRSKEGAFLFFPSCGSLHFVTSN